MAKTSQERRFMEIAVEEMLRSRAEHTDKADPLVGAVIVDSKGHEIARTHRGGLRDGNHAEFTLIERKLQGKKLDGSTLYVTLEPCTRRNPPKKPCVKWIVGARIDRVVVGMPDPNPDVSGHGIRYLQTHRVQVDLFDVDLVNRIQEANLDFIEYFNTAGREDKTNDVFEGSSDTEDELVANATVEDLSLDAIRKYLILRKKELPIPSDILWNFLYKNGLLARNESDVYVPTVAGVVLFANEPVDFLPQVRISLEAQIGERFVTDEFVGPLLDFCSKIDGFLKKHMRSFTEIREFERVEEYEYPIEALREAAFNAVAHRDYRGGQRVMIRLLSDRVEFISPGLPLQPLTLERLRSFNAPPYSRNPRIAITFKHMTWIEEKASGILRMRDLMLKRRLRPPRFDVDGTYLKVTFLGEEQAWRNIRVSPGFLEQLEVLDKQLVELFIDRGRLSTSDCAKFLGVHVATARRHLRKLYDKYHIIEPEGQGAKFRYVLKGR